MTGEGGKKRAFAGSVAIHAVLVGTFPFLLASFRGVERPEKVEITFYRASELRELPPTPPPPPPPPPVRKATPERPRPAASPPPAPAPQVASVKPPPAPAVASIVPVRQAPPEPPAPAPQRAAVRTNLLQEPRTGTVATKNPAPPTRSAGFGAPAPAAPPQRANLRGTARPGGFEIDPHPPAAGPPAADKGDRGVARTAFGTETEVAPPRESAAGSRGSVQNTGFSAEAPAGPVAGSGSKPGAVSTGGFGDVAAEPAAAPAPERKRPAENPDTPVEIVSKPRPVYTAEARQMKVEGEVVLEVIFVATGEMRVLGVVEGLGHGLDEAAVDAARRIEFKPARRSGKAVDYKAVLRIVFQLA